MSMQSGLFEYPSMGAYVKIKFVLIRVMVGELCSYTRTIFVEIDSADAYRGCHIEHSRS